MQYKCKGLRLSGVKNLYGFVATGLSSGFIISTFKNGAKLTPEAAEDVSSLRKSQSFLLPVGMFEWPTWRLQDAVPQKWRHWTEWCK